MLRVFHVGNPATYCNNQVVLNDARDPCVVFYDRVDALKAALKGMEVFECNVSPNHVRAFEGSTPHCREDAVGKRAACLVHPALPQQPYRQVCEGQKAYFSTVLGLIQEIRKKRGKDGRMRVVSEWARGDDGVQFTPAKVWREVMNGLPKYKGTSEKTFCGDDLLMYQDGLVVQTWTRDRIISKLESLARARKKSDP